MAESLDKLEGEITCSLCLFVFQEPRKLPCDHVYCTACLVRLASFRKNSTIECPQCRKTFQVQKGQVTDFQVAFHINRLKDVYNELSITFRHASISSDAEALPNACKEHKTQPIAMYCETCSELICRDCVLDGTKHKDHQTGFIGQIAERFRGELNELAEPLKEMEQKTTVALEKVKETEAAIKSQGELLQESIDIAFAEIISKLKQEKSTLEREASETIQEKLRNVGQQANTIQQTRSQLQTTLSSIETAKQATPEPDLITTQRDLKSSIKAAQDDFTSLNLIPCELGDVGIEISTAEAHANIWRENSFIFSLADPQTSTVIGAPLSLLETNTRGILEVSILDSSGKPCIGRQSVSVDFHQVRDEAPGIMQITDIGAGQHRIILQVANRGRYKLSIEVNGCHIAQSPYQLFVTKPPIQLGTPIKKIGNLKSPSGLSYSMDKLLVSNHDHDVLTIIDSKGNRELIKLPAMLPTGALYDKDGNLYVCTAQDSKLHKFDKSGERLKSTMTGQFKFPNGIILSKNNELYICDSQQDRIRILDTDLSYRDSITTKSVKSGVQCTPTDIDIDEDGKLYVVEHGNQRIVVLDSNGLLIRTISPRRSGSLLQGMSFSSANAHGKLVKPAGMKVFGEHVYVADWESNCVFVFTKEGSLVTTFGEDVLTHPEGLTIDSDGYIYVAHNRKEVIKF